MTVAVLVETSELLSTIAASALAGIGVTVIFSVGLLGVIRFADLNRDDRPLAAAAMASVAAVALLACVAAVVIGIVVMTHK